VSAREQVRRRRTASARPPDAPTFFATPARFRAWLARNADQASVLAPILLGRGVPLLERLLPGRLALSIADVEGSPLVTHLTYRLAGR
jgi:hypothetical protein